MKQKQQFKELSDEELKDVKGGAKSIIAPGGVVVMCYQFECEMEGKELDLKTCECIEKNPVPNGKPEPSIKR